MATITTIAPGHWLDTAPAASYARMRADGCPAGITDAGRTNAEQIALFTDRYTTNYAASAKFDRRVWQGRTYWRKPGCDSAATPGESKHETGRALDLPAAAAAWVRAYGAPYGWIADLVPGEWWHFEFEDVRVTYPTPAPATAQEDDMTPEQDNLLRHIVAMLGEVPVRTATAVWATPVSRVPGAPTTILQDTVDGTTAALSTVHILTEGQAN